MLLEIKDLLSEGELARLRDIAGRIRFIDGRASNTGFAEKVNLQADPTEGEAGEAGS